MSGGGGVPGLPGNACTPTAGVRAEEEVVVFNTGASQKYPEVVLLALLPRLDKDRPVPYESLAENALPV